jgi:hypothetical protein
MEKPLATAAFFIERYPSSHARNLFHSQPQGFIASEIRGA